MNQSVDKKIDEMEVTTTSESSPPEQELEDNEPELLLSDAICTLTSLIISSISVTISFFVLYQIMEIKLLLIAIANYILIPMGIVCIVAVIIAYSSKKQNIIESRDTVLPRILLSFSIGILIYFVCGIIPIIIALFFYWLSSDIKNIDTIHL